MRSTLPGHDATPRIREARNLQFVGAGHYQHNLAKLTDHIVPSRTGYLRLGTTAVLVAETNNERDPTAVGVHVGGLCVGHLKSEDAATYHPELMALLANHGRYVSITVTIAGPGLVRRSDGERKRADWLNTKLLRVFLGGIHTKGQVPVPVVREIARRSYRIQREIPSVVTATAMEPRLAKRSAPPRDSEAIEPATGAPNELFERLRQSVAMTAREDRPKLTVLDGGLSQ